jgi:hypothetical protein
MLNGIIQIVHSEDEFERWIGRAVTGDVAEYHRGFLAIDRDPHLTGLNDTAIAACIARCDGAASAARLEWVHLFQRRLGPGRFSYLAVRRGSPLLGDLPAQVQKRRQP